MWNPRNKTNTTTTKRETVINTENILGREAKAKVIKRYKLPVIKQRSHRDEKYSIENTVDYIVVTLYAERR